MNWLIDIASRAIETYMLPVPLGACLAFMYLGFILGILNEKASKK